MTFRFQNNLPWGGQSKSLQPFLASSLWNIWTGALISSLPSSVLNLTSPSQSKPGSCFMSTLISGFKFEPFSFLIFSSSIFPNIFCIYRWWAQYLKTVWNMPHSKASSDWLLLKDDNNTDPKKSHKHWFSAWQDISEIWTESSWAYADCWASFQNAIRFGLVLALWWKIHKFTKLLIILIN